MLTIIYSHTSITKHWKQKLMPEISEISKVKHLKQILSTRLDESWTRQNFQILGLTKNFQDLSSELVKKNCYKYSCWNTLPDLLSGYWTCLFIHWRVYLGQSKWKNINSMQVKLGCMEKDITKSELITATFFWQVYWEFLETGGECQTLLIPCMLI